MLFAVPAVVVPSGNPRDYKSVLAIEDSHRFVVYLATREQQSHPFMGFMAEILTSLSILVEHAVDVFAFLRLIEIERSDVVNKYGIVAFEHGLIDHIAQLRWQRRKN
jgi:hypothetical protein